MGEHELMRVTNIVTSMIVIVAVVVTHFDTKAAPLRLKGMCRKAAYRASLTVFLAAIGFGEGFAAFNWFFHHGKVPGETETITGIAWAFLGLWMIVMRPFGRLEILCPFAKDCPTVHAQQRGDESPEEALERTLVTLGTTRAGGCTHGSP